MPKLCLCRCLLPSSPLTSHRHHPSSPPTSPVGLSSTSSRALAGDFQFVSLRPHQQIRFAALSIESDNLSSPEPSDQPRLISSIGSAPFLQPLQSVIITPAHIRLLTFCACAAAISTTWLFFSTIPTLLDLKRSASSLEKLMDAVYLKSSTSNTGSPNIWEKHQSEEEAVLGRGKRQRKVVSYKEAYAAHPIETLSEALQIWAGEYQQLKPEPNPKPEKEYTPAGRALKTKYTKLRARQKERLARRHDMEASASSEKCTGIQFLQSQAQDGNLTPLFIQHSEKNSSALFIGGSSCGQTQAVPKSKNDSNIRTVKLPKCKLSEHLGQPLHDFQLNPGEGTSCVSSEGNTPLVIGLCAPNANQMESSQKKFSRLNNRKNRVNLGSELLTSTAAWPATSDEMGTKFHENVSGKSKLEDTPLDVSHSRSKIGIHDLYHPFNSQGEGSAVNLEGSASSYAAFQEKMALPKLPFDNQLLPRYPFPAENFAPPHPGIFPSMSLGSRVITDVNEPHHDASYPKFNGCNVIENIVVVNDPDVSYITPKCLERYKKLTGLQTFLLDGDRILGLFELGNLPLHAFATELVSTDRHYGTPAYNGSLRGTPNGSSMQFAHNGSLRGTPLTCTDSAPLPLKTNSGDIGHAMIVLPTHPSEEDWRDIVVAAKGGYAITESAASGQIRPVHGLLDIGECEDT